MIQELITANFSWVFPDSRTMDKAAVDQNPAPGTISLVSLERRAVLIGRSICHSNPLFILKHFLH